MNGVVVFKFIYADKIKTLLLFIAFSSVQIALGQSVDLKKHNEEKEKILNVIINSFPFDSVYGLEEVVFTESDLLVKNAVQLRKGQDKVKIETENSGKNNRFVSLGYMSVMMPTDRVGIQLYLFPQKLTMNINLRKTNNEWKITYYEFQED